MARITSSDHVLLLLRERLQRLDRSRGSKAGKIHSGQRPTPPPLERLQALSGLGELDGDDLGRSLVRALLAQEFGDAAAKDPAFQMISEDVFRMICATEEGRGLIDRAARQLRSED